MSAERIVFHITAGHGKHIRKAVIRINDDVKRREAKIIDTGVMRAHGTVHGLAESLGTQEHWLLDFRETADEGRVVHEQAFVNQFSQLMMA